ncbi:hypothetical protein B296_00045624, partial [Ensete ventricosum]
SDEEEEVGAAGSDKQQGLASSGVRREVATTAGDNWARLQQRWLQREEDEEGVTRGDYSSKGGWLQPSPSVARWGGRMGDGDAIEGWKATAAREEKEAVGVRRGLQQQGLARKRGRKVRRARLEKRSRRGMADG